MGVFKEEAHTFEDVARHQVQIWNDSADYGFAYQTADPPVAIRQLIESINKFKALDGKYPEETPFIRKRTVWSGGVTLVIRIAWEIDEGAYCGTQYTISFNRIKNPKHPNLIMKGADAFISVDIERYREPVKSQATSNTF